MASSSLPSSFIFFFFTLLLISSSISEAKDFLIGGTTNAWKIPLSTSESLNRWAEATRFQVGDSLVWKYEGDKDSVLQVTREDYLSCKTSNPVQEHKDGNTIVKLNQSGPYYFISGAKGTCEEGEKLIVVVISKRHLYGGISPAPSPAEYGGPAVSPTSMAPNLVVLRRGYVGALFVLGVVGMVL